MSLAEKQIEVRIAPEIISANTRMAKYSASLDNLSFSVHTTSSSQAIRVKSFIARKYYAVHKATLNEFMPQLLEMHRGSSIYGGAGIKPGDFGEFFLEQYLDKPIECLIAEHKRQPINRSSIAEIGNFAVAKSGLSPVLITMVAKTLQLAGFKWMVFTATTEVENLIRNLGGDTFTVADAKPEKLSDSVVDWGSYYKSKPIVMVCDLSKTINNAQNNTYLKNLFQEFNSSILNVSQQIKSSI